MKTKYFFLSIISLFVLGTVGAHVAKADYRNVTVVTPSAQQVEYSFGRVMTTNAKMPSGWTVGSMSIQNPNPISNSSDFSQILPLTSTTSFSIPTDGMQITFLMKISTNDASVSSSAYANAINMNVQLVDASDGSVLATMYTVSSLSNVAWGPNNIISQDYNVSASLGGHSAFVRMVVAWNLPSDPATYNFNATSNIDGFTMTAPASKESSPIAASANSISLSNAPNPVVNATTITVANVTGAASLKIYDFSGRTVADLSSAITSGSTSEVSFNATELHSGMYLIRLVTAAGVMQRHMIVKH